MTHGVPVRIGLVDFDPAQGVGTGESFNVTVEMDEPIDQIDGQEVQIAYTGVGASGLQGGPKGAPQIQHIEAGDDSVTFALVCNTAGALTVTATTELEEGPQSVAGVITIV